MRALKRCFIGVQEDLKDAPLPVRIAVWCGIGLILALPGILTFAVVCIGFDEAEDRLGAVRR